MTIRTIPGRGFVKQDRLALNLALQSVAHRAAHIGVRPCQRELCAVIVVKRGRSPPQAYMAIPTFCNSVLSNKLAAVRIGMASFAIRRRSLELNLVGTGRHLVALIAQDRAMSPDERKFRFRMIEASNVDPGSGAVTRFAPERRPIGALLHHPRLEFSLMGIHVTGGARAVLEMERQYPVRSSAKSHLVALRAGDGQVRPGQYETGVVVFGNREGRAMKVLYGMAILATILVGPVGELFVMGVLMAVCARREFHLIDGSLPCRGVTFGASDGGVFCLQRIMRSRVFFHAKLRWLPAFDRMAFRTFSLARPRLELPFVGIRGVAIRASGKGQRFLEIAPLVAVAATNFQMHPEQRILCFRMVELHRRIHLFPTGCRMTGFARSLESPLVRVGVARQARVEPDSGELHRLLRSGGEVAPLTGDLGVHSGERVLGLRMVELLRLLPVVHRVAATTVGAELSLVHVLMAGDAVLREP